MPRDNSEPHEGNVARLELLPGVVDAELLRLSGLLETATERLAKAIQQDASAESRWKKLEAASLLRSERKSEDLRRAEALDANAEAYTMALSARAVAEAMREKCRSLRNQLEALRTLAANLRAQT